MSRHVEAEIYNKYAVFVRGHGTRDALVAVVGKAPVWSTQRRAWVCSERTFRERLLPHLEHLNYSVTITGPRATRAEL